MTAGEMLRSDQFNEFGQISLKEASKMEIVNNYSGVAGRIEKIWQENFGDESLKFYLQELFDYIGEYHDLIVRFNYCKKNREDDFRDLAIIDDGKRKKHNALISQICIINRYLNKKSANISNVLPFSLPSDPYELSFRVRITVWAQEVYFDVAKIKAEIKRELN